MLYASEAGLFFLLIGVVCTLVATAVHILKNPGRIPAAGIL